MIYIALLRGINVGGKNRVEMKRLKALLEHEQATDVITYINSGNVVFNHPQQDKLALQKQIETAIQNHFGFYVKVLLLKDAEYLRVASALPDDWHNDSGTKCDVLFLWDSYDKPTSLDDLPLRPGIDTAVYVPGAIIWSVNRKDVTKSGLLKIVGTDLYRHVTIRNCNTTRKITAIIEKVSAQT